MRKFIIYSAISLNGKIARKDGNIDWLNEMPNPDGLDYGYYDFYESIDTTIQGYNTYQQVCDMDVEFPYKGKNNYVITRKKTLPSDENVEFINENIIEHFKALRNQDGKDLWIIGGGQINSMFWNAGLVDKMILHVMPIILPDGIDLLEGVPSQMRLNTLGTRTYSTGVVELTYLPED